MKVEPALLFTALSLLAGAMIPFQSAMNAQLSKTLQSPYYAALFVFIVATAALGIYIAANKMQLPAVSSIVAAPAWSYLGGLLGGTYILLIVVCAPKLGIGTVTVMVLLGQILAAIVIDQFGWMRSAVHPLQWQRVVGLVLLIAGVYLVKKF